MYRGMDINPNNIVMLPLVRPDGEGYTHPKSRTRVVYKMFDRAPDGQWLEKDQGPLGFRTPNGLVWGHALDELGYITRAPGLYVATVYSRSQIKELGELYDDDEFEGPLVRPRVRRPWPVLKLPKKHPANTDPPLGAIDQGCEEEHCEDPECRTYTMRWDEFSDDKRSTSPATNPGTSVSAPAPPRRCSADSAQVCRGNLEPNNTSPPLVNAKGHPYDYLWCDHFVERLQAHKRPFDLLAHTVHLINRDTIAADQRGIMFFDSPEEMHAHGFVPRADGTTVPVIDVPDDRELTAQHEAPLEMRLPDVDDCSETHQTDESDAQPDDDAKPTSEVPSPSGLFSMQGLPKLEEFIPEGLFPDVLLVHDPQQLTNHKQTGGEPVKYKRVYPVLPRDGTEHTMTDKTEELVANLHLDSANQLGSGHHSFVYRAPLTLPPPLSARSRTGQCTVAAKLAYRRCTDHRLLHNEADVYNALPKDAQEEYCGLNIVPPCHRFPVPVGAIVPKLFGFYMPEGESAEMKRDHASCSEGSPCRVNWMSPILLMEECGEPVQPEKFTADQRCVEDPFTRSAALDNSM